MQNLHDIEAIKKIDPQDTLGSTELSVKQFQTAWEEVKALSITPFNTAITSVVFCGIGASVYGALVVKSLFQEKLPFPIEIISDYHLPVYINGHTLVVLTSYSGTTEEVLSCAKEAKEKNAQMLVLTKGGLLADFAKSNNIPAYIFDGKLNPAGIPRLGNGYTIVGLLGLFTKLGLISVADKAIQNAFSYAQSKQGEIKQRAMKDSETLLNKIPVIFAAEHLAGNAQILRNQCNETSKTFSACYLVPDLNHHLMEGLQFPKPSQLYFVILNSAHYSEKITKRMLLTRRVVEQNQQSVMEFQSGGANIYEDFLEILSYGSYLTLYLGLRYDQNPAINPWVDYFKNELAK